MRNIFCEKYFYFDKYFYFEKYLYFDKYFCVEKYFYFANLGGDWTAENVGVGSDSCGGWACGGLPELWCKRYRYAQQHTFAYKQFLGRQNAIELAREFVRRSELFIRLCIDSDDKAAFRYTPAINALYDDHPEFAAWMVKIGVNHPAFKRGHDLTLEFPQEPVA